jgi:hypothetical protein
MTDTVDLYHKPGENGELSGLDARLLEIVASNHRITPNELAEQLNIETMSPERCAQRVREILNAQDWLGRTGQNALLLRDLIELRNVLFERVKGTDIKIGKDGEIVEVGSNAAFANALVRVLREWRVTVKEMQEEVDGESAKLRQSHADVMVAAIAIFGERFAIELGKNHPEITRKELDDLVEASIPKAFQVIQSKVA